MAKIKIDRAVILEERVEETTIEESLYLIISELAEDIYGEYLNTTVA